jgi:hypothetical protein
MSFLLFNLTQSIKKEKLDIHSESKFGSSNFDFNTPGRLTKRNAYRIAVSGFKLPKKETQELEKLGLKVIEDRDRGFNILVLEHFKRTVKFLLAINKGATIIQRDWLYKCLEKEEIVDYSDFLLRDDLAEKNFDFRLEESLETARNTKGFLNGYKVWVAEKVEPSIEDLWCLIETAGGLISFTKPNVDEENNIIIVNPDDKKKYTSLIERGYKVYKPELILSGCLRQRLQLEDFEIKL